MSKAPSDYDSSQNAFNNFDNMEYLYSYMDMKLIGEKLLQEKGEGEGVILADPLGEDAGSRRDGITLTKKKEELLSKIQKLTISQKIVGICHINGNHWIAYVLFKDGDQIKCYYKDSLGKIYKDFERVFEDAFYKDEAFVDGLIQPLGGKAEQNLDFEPLVDDLHQHVSCGIFALKNMLELANIDLSHTDSIAFFTPGNTQEKYNQSIRTARQEFAEKYFESVFFTRSEDFKYHKFVEQHQVIAEKIVDYLSTYQPEISSYIKKIETASCRSGEKGYLFQIQLNNAEGKNPVRDFINRLLKDQKVTEIGSSDLYIKFKPEDLDTDRILRTLNEEKKIKIPKIEKLRILLQMISDSPNFTEWKETFTLSKKQKLDLTKILIDELYIAEKDREKFKGLLKLKLKIMDDTLDADISRFVEERVAKALAVAQAEAEKAAKAKKLDETKTDDGYNTTPSSLAKDDGYTDYPGGVEERKGDDAGNSDTDQRIAEEKKKLDQYLGTLQAGVGAGAVCSFLAIAANTVIDQKDKEVRDGSDSRGRSSVSSHSFTNDERSNSNFVGDVDLILNLMKKIDGLSKRETYDFSVIGELISIGEMFSLFSRYDEDKDNIRNKYEKSEKIIKFEKLANLKFLKKDEKGKEFVKNNFEEIKNCFNLLSNNLKKILKNENVRIVKLFKDDESAEIDSIIKSFQEQTVVSGDNLLDKLSAYLGDVKYISEIVENINFFENHIKDIEFDDKKGAEILAFGWFITAIGENSKKLSDIVKLSGLGKVFKILSKARDTILKDRETAFLFPYDDDKIVYLSNLKKEYQDNIDNLKSILLQIEHIFKNEEFTIDSYTKEKFDAITYRINQIDLAEYISDYDKVKKLKEYYKLKLDLISLKRIIESIENDNLRKYFRKNKHDIKVLFEDGNKSALVVLNEMLEKEGLSKIKLGRCIKLRKEVDKSEEKSRTKESEIKLKREELKKLNVCDEKLDIEEEQEIRNAIKLLDKEYKDIKKLQEIPKQEIRNAIKLLDKEYKDIKKLQEIPKLVELLTTIYSDSELEEHSVEINLDLDVRKYASNFTIAILRQYFKEQILDSIENIFISESPLESSIDKIRQMGNKITHLDIDAHEEAYDAIKQNLDDWKDIIKAIVTLLSFKKAFYIYLFGDEIYAKIQSQLFVHVEFSDDDKKMIKNLVLINSLNQLGLYNQVKKIIAEIDKKEDGKNSLLNKYLKDSANNSEIKFCLLREISVPYDQSGESKICLEYYLKCLNKELINQEHISPFGIAMAYSEIGVINKKLGIEYAQVLVEYFESLFQLPWCIDWLKVTKEEYSYKTKLLLQTMLSYADTYLSLGKNEESITKLGEFEKNIKSILGLEELTLEDMVGLDFDLAIKYYRTKSLIYDGNIEVTSECNRKLEKLCSNDYESEWKKAYGQTYESEKNEIIVFFSHGYVQIYRNSSSDSEKQNCFEKLKKVHEEFLKKYSGTYGSETTRYAEICFKFAIIYQDFEKYQDAEKRFLESEGIYNSLLGEDSKIIDVANLKSALGRNYKYMNNMEYYKKYSKEASEIFKYNITKSDTQHEGIYYFSKHIVNSIATQINFQYTSFSAKKVEDEIISTEPDNKITIIKDIVENELRKNIIDNKEIFRKLLEKVKEDFFRLWHMGNTLDIKELDIKESDIKESDISDSFQVEKYISDSGADSGGSGSDSVTSDQHYSSGEELLGIDDACAEQ